MMSVSSELIPVEVCKGINGLDKVVLREDRGWSAEVYLFGAHVTSWKNKHGEEFFFSSRKATFEPPLRTHGGIRICFPQFEKHGSLQLHGFARRRFWTLDPNPPPLPETSHTKAFVDLILKPSGQDLNIWPHSFEFRLRVTLAPGGDLILTSRVRNVNTDGKPFSFSFAYHLYFPVIGEVQIEGLETDYLDELKNKESLTGDEESEDGELYSYSEVNSKTAGEDQWKIESVLTMDGIPGPGSPWLKKLKGLVDVGKDETDLKLRLETAAVENPITLNPGMEWKGILEVNPINPAA